MSEADKMFEKLWYKKIIENEEKIIYRHIKEPAEIIFDFIDKWVCVYGENNEALYFDMQELKAINKKCEELGWI